MNKKNLKIIGLAVMVSLITVVSSLFLFRKYFIPKHETYLTDNPAKVHYINYESSVAEAGPNNFTEAANEVIPVTVHINTKVAPQGGDQGYSNPFSQLFGDPFSGRGYRSPGKLGSGSGVIISSDGYIVTNNHVIDGADDIAVTLNNGKSYKGKVIGADPNTDLAVLKIDEKGLPYATFSNSDDVQIGQWVLACGYPLNLQTTVTAGIISAKSRNIGVNTGSLDPIETYIQTDAAVNPGNSGGPLVDTNGKLVGINSAIATPTGSFAGYAYAVPSNLVRKVANDLMKYGKVQRAFLGIYLERENQMKSMTASFDNTGKDVEPGALVSGVTEGGAAGEAGIKEGDRILSVDNFKVVNQSDILGILARYKPGDKVNIAYSRSGKEHTAEVTLKNKYGNTEVVQKTVLDAMGAKFITLNKAQAESLGISGGVLVGEISKGLISSQTDMDDLFVIVGVGNYSVKNENDLRNALEKQGNNVILKGFYIDGRGRRVSDMMYYAMHDVKAGAVN